LREEKIPMAVFYIGSYDIVAPDEFQKYPPLVMALLPKYGGVVLASDTAGFLVEGTARTMNAIIRFPSKEAALGLYNDAAYQEAKRIRQESTRNVSMVLVAEYQARAAARGGVLPAVPELSIYPGDAGDEAVGLDRAKYRP
jgi:uncharacterized protein (DUF1330 family)